MVFKTVEMDGAGAETERARDSFGLRNTGIQIRSRIRRERVRPGSVRTVTSALESFLGGRRVGGSKPVVDADVSCVDDAEESCGLFDDNDDDGSSRSGVDRDRCLEGI